MRTDGHCRFPQHRLLQVAESQMIEALPPNIKTFEAQDLKFEGD